MSTFEAATPPVSLGAKPYLFCSATPKEIAGAILFAATGLS